LETVLLPFHFASDSWSKSGGEEKETKASDCRHFYSRFPPFSTARPLARQRPTALTRYRLAALTTPKIRAWLP
jgi:hypothetical protein